MTDCPFCQRIVRGECKAEGAGLVSFEPLNPVSTGHRLFVPTRHVEHRENPYPHRQETASAVAQAFLAAHRYAVGLEWDFNLVTSSGPDATQTIDHVHVHYVPRRHGDGLLLPWSDVPTVGTTEIVVNEEPVATYPVPPSPRRRWGW
jgi:histidine triad (HIT) family protein